MNSLMCVLAHSTEWYITYKVVVTDKPHMPGL
jgi:hypothetical protein